MSGAKPGTQEKEVLAVLPSAADEETASGTEAASSTTPCVSVTATTAVPGEIALVRHEDKSNHSNSCIMIIMIIMTIVISHWYHLLSL